MCVVIFNWRIATTGTHARAQQIHTQQIYFIPQPQSDTAYGVRRRRGGILDWRAAHTICRKEFKTVHTFMSAHAFARSQASNICVRIAL